MRRILSAEKLLTNSSKRWLYAVWAVLIGGFAVLHALHLSADFPNHTAWFSDWAKYTDEGWYGNAAIRAHLYGNWYVRGDFNPAPAVPVWPFLEWILFFFTGVSIEAARGLAVGFFFLNLLLSYLLLRTRGPRWMALLALTLVVTSPFLYCFSRLAILEPMLIAFTLAALNLAVRLPKMRRPVVASVCIGLLYTLMMLTKTTAVFLLPTLAWAMIVPLWKQPKLGPRCFAVAAGSFVISFGLWMAFITHLGLLHDYRYLFFINKYIKPPEFYWPILSFWWSFHGGLWVDQILIPLAGLMVVGALLAWRSAWGRKLLLDPVFGASVWAVVGYILFMTYQNHPQPRYYAVVAFFSFFVVALGIGALLGAESECRRESSPVAEEVTSDCSDDPTSGAKAPAEFAGLNAGTKVPAYHPAYLSTWCSENYLLLLGWVALAVAAIAVVSNSAETLGFAAHPEYSFVNAARQLTQYVDEHPNGKRLLVSISGDQITLMTQLPTLCDDFGTQELVSKLPVYQPGWYATWNDLDPGELEDIHTHFSLEQVASYRAFDDPDRNVLVLFKLHPLANGVVRDPMRKNLQIVLPEDNIQIPIE